MSFLSKAANYLTGLLNRADDKMRSALAKPLPAPPQISLPPNASPRVRQAYEQAKPYINRAQQKYNRYEKSIGADIYAARNVFQYPKAPPIELQLGEGFSPRVYEAQRSAQGAIDEAKRKYATHERAAQLPVVTYAKTLEGLGTLFEQPGFKQVAQIGDAMSRGVVGAYRGLKSDNPLNVFPSTYNAAKNPDADLVFNAVSHDLLNKGFPSWIAYPVALTGEFITPDPADFGTVGRRAGKAGGLADDAADASKLGKASQQFDDAAKAQPVKLSKAEEAAISKWYDETPPESPLTPHGVRDRVADAWNRFRKNITSEYAPFDPIEKNLYTRAGKDQPVLRLSRRLEQSAGDTGKATLDVRQFNRGVVRRIPYGHYQDFSAYLKLRRAKDRLMTDPDARAVGSLTIDEVENQLSILRKKVGDETFSQIERLAHGEFQAAADYALRLQVQSGRLTPEAYAGIRASNEFYAPYRVLRSLEEVEGSFAGRVGGLSGTKDLTGKVTGIHTDDFRLGDPVQEMAEQIYRSRLLAEKNKKMLEVRKLALLDEDGSFFKFLRRSEDVQRRIDIYRNISRTLKEEIRPAIREARQVGKLDKKTATRLRRLEKDYTNELARMEDEFAAFMNGEQTIQMFVPEARSLKTLPDELASGAREAKVAKSYEEFSKSSYVDKLYTEGQLERAGFNSKREFYNFVREGFVKTPEKTRTRTISGVTGQDLVKRQRSTEKIARQKDRLANIDKKSLEDRLNFLEKNIKTKKAKVQEMRKEAMSLKDKKTPPGYHTVTYFKNGIVERLAVPKDIAEALTGSNHVQTGILAKALSVFKAPVMMGATGMNLTFQVVNLFFADIPRNFIMFRFGPSLVKAPLDVVRYPFDYTYAFMSAIKGNFNFGGESKLYNEFLESGAANSTIQRWLTPSSFTPRPTLAPRSLKKKIGYAVVDSLPRFASAVEETSKLAGFKIGKRTIARTGNSMDELITEVRNFSGSPDFWRKGKHGHELNLLFLFLNARIQGTASDFSRLFGRAEGGMKAATPAWAKLTAVVGAPALTLALWNKREEYREDYEKVPEWEKQNYFMIPREKFFFNEEGQRVREYWRVPKREAVKLFANFVEAGVDFAYKRDGEAVKRFGVELIEGMSPLNISGETMGERAESVVSSTNPIVSGPLEYFGNRDTFRHRPIVSRYRQGLPDRLQYNNDTLPFYRKLGEKLDTSPALLQNLAENFGANIAHQFIVKPKQEGREGDAYRLPVVQRFVSSGFINQPGIERNLLLIKEQEGQAFELRMKALEKYEELKRINNEQGKDAAKQAYDLTVQQNPEIEEKLLDLFDDEKNGLNFEFSLLKQLGVKNGFRATRIVEMLNGLDTREQKKEMYNALLKSGVMSSKTEKQVLYLLDKIQKGEEAHLPFELSAGLDE